MPPRVSFSDVLLKRHALVEESINGLRATPTQVRFQHEVYPHSPGAPGSTADQPVSRQVFTVQDLEIRDRLATSQMNKFLYLYSSKEMPRKAHSNMVREAVMSPSWLVHHHVTPYSPVILTLLINFSTLFLPQLTVRALHMCPEAGQAPQECCLRVSLMPLRLNVDQVTNKQNPKFGLYIKWK